MILQEATIVAMTIPFKVSLVTSEKEKGQAILKQLLLKVSQALEGYDQKFSPFKEDSLVTRFRAGDTMPLWDTEFQSVYAQVIAAKDRSRGYFDPYIEGDYDPTGFVKGWLIEEIFRHYLAPCLRDGSCQAIALNGGGDMQLGVADGEAYTWKVGIENPKQLNQFLAIYPLQNGAIASSGQNKRGEHIRLKGPADLLQVTVIDDSLSWADSWATALFAAGLEEARNLMRDHDLSGLLVTKDDLFIFQAGQEIDQKGLD